MAIGAQNFRRVGGFDERFFLYHEEEILARRLADIGVPVMLEPGAVITHIGGVSTRLRSSIPLDASSLPAWSAHQYYRGTALLYQSQYPGPIAFAAVLLLWTVLLIMAALTPIRTLTGLRSDKTASWYRAAAGGAINGWFHRMTMPPDIE
jgi:GT2 family glycosyltransferase